MKINPLTCIDFYKADHKSQYPKDTTLVYSNFTPRSNRLAKAYEADKAVFFGLSYFIQDYLIELFNREFFNKPKAEVVAYYKRRMDTSLGEGAINVSHIEALHALGYLPIKIKALPEGSLVPMGVPCLTIVNTKPEFFWLTNYIESVLSAYLWHPMTSATIAFQYRKLLESYAEKTGTAKDFVKWQAHDFSFRGMSGVESAAASGAGHLTSFTGTDTVPAIDFLEQFYMANADKELIAGSVPATEHSVMCMGEKELEADTFKRLLTTVYPSGIVSVVSDTWDFWKVVTETVKELKETILQRDGKLVIRPDSGDPVDIICGTDNVFETDERAQKGAVECLWDVFGGTTTSTGHKLLDSHIGLIYGDSITYARAEEILRKLEAKGFASGNVVFGIGSYTYQYVTRDTFGMAVKSTYGEVAGVGREIFKDPKTDSGIKKSAKGLLRVEFENDTFKLYDNQTKLQEDSGALMPVFEDGKCLIAPSLALIRENIDSHVATAKVEAARKAA